MFVYKINSEWWLIVAERHYYYNVETKESQWQLPEHLDFKDLNVDEISVLIAKYNGLKIETVQSQNEEENEADVSLPSTESIEDALEGPKEDEEIVPVDLVQEVDEPVDANAGLDLGYLSSEESEEDQENEAETEVVSSNNIDDSIQVESEEDVDVDDLVNNILNDEESDQDQEGEDTSSLEQQLIEIFDENKDKISIYDPYSITEEELISTLSRSPVFYGLSFSQRETIYNKWCTPETKEKFPTEKQLMMNYLFEHKKDIKTKYFVEFKSRLSSFNVPQKEKIFLKYKNVLNNQTDFERSYKKDKTVNLKKLKLTEYLKPLLKKKKVDISGDDDWEKWVSLCNNMNLPREIVENELNWIVGPTKRLECYLECLS